MNSDNIIHIMEGVINVRTFAESYSMIPNKLKQILNEQYKQVNEMLNKQFMYFSVKINDLAKTVREEDVMPLQNAIQAFLDGSSEKAIVENGQKVFELVKDLKVNPELKLDKVKFFDYTIIESKSKQAIDGLKNLDPEGTFPVAMQALRAMEIRLAEEEWESLNKFAPKVRLRQSPKKSNNYHIGKREIFDSYTMVCEIQNIVSLGEFYIRNLDLKSEQDQFLENFQRFYENRTNLRNLSKSYVGYFAVCKIKGKWHRVKVHSVAKFDRNVFLLDAGLYATVKASELIRLHDQFYSQSQISIKCCFGEIEPTDAKENFPPKALNEFKSIVQDQRAAQNYFRVEFTKDMEQDSDKAAPCIVKICGIEKETKIINFNSVLVTKGYAKSTGPASMGPMAYTDPSFEQKTAEERRQKVEQESKDIELKIRKKKMRTPTKHVHVDILNRKMCTPDNVLVTVKCRDEEFLELDNELQEGKENKSSSSDWKAGDLCLVFRVRRGQPNGHWCRGKIVDKVESERFHVALFDYGIEEIYPRIVLQDMPEKYKNIPQFSFKLRLAHAVPGGFASFWSDEALKTFREILSHYISFAISVVTEADENGITSVVLYGVVEKNPEQHHDILNYMCHKGLACKNQTDCEEQLVKPWNLKYYNEADVDATGSELLQEIIEEEKKLAEIKKEEPPVPYAEAKDGSSLFPLKPTIIKAWPPANPFQLEQYLIGRVYHVDRDGIFYFQAADEMEQIKEMTRALTQHYRNPSAISNLDIQHKTLSPGDCVIARYFEDGMYYRAMIIRQSMLNKRAYRTQFVDFGNYVNVSINDIFAKVMAENIPLQVHRFVLSGITPKEADHWNDEELDYFFKATVDRYCSINIFEDVEGSEDIKGVKIKVVEVGKEIYDLARHAVENDIARFRLSSDQWPIPFKKADEPVKIQSDDEDDEMLGATGNGLETTGNGLETTPNFVIASLSEMKSFLSKQHFKAPSASNDTHTNITRATVAKNKLKKGTVFLDLRATDHEEFKCSLVDTFDAMNLTFLIEPDIPEIQNAFDAMMKHVQEKSADYYGDFRNLGAALGKACLILSETGGYLRGEVTGIDGDSARVLLVDSGKTEYFDLNQLKKMDVVALKCPRKILKIGLNVDKKICAIGEKFSKEIMKKFRGQKMKAIVQSYDDENFPVVDLVDESGKCIYEDYLKPEE